MIESREHFYQPGLPAKPGEHYRALVRFARRHAGRTVLDLGCGFAAYSDALVKEGLQCVGGDINLDYLRSAPRQSVPVVNVGGKLPFADKSFDSVLLFEVIEHVSELEAILSEAFRVARRNVLITAPNSEDIELMKANDVTYAHMLSSDHVHFFDADGLRQLLSRYGASVSVERGDPIYPFWFVGRSLSFYALRVLFRLGLLKPRFFCRLYAVASVRQN